MKTTAYLAFLLVVCSLAEGSRADNLPPPPVPAAASPCTLWQFLGIPQAAHEFQGAHLNKLGNKPDKEVKPPLKGLADPANLQSPNPAIKKAAEIKQEEDLAPQKIKAIKYLATIGCACHPGVKDALLAALDDCTEAVRYEAVLAFCHAAGNPCKTCNKNSCCGPDVKKKLREMADGMDANGCLKEPSPRVRAAAAAALNACNMVTPEEPVVPTPVPEKIEVPTPARPERAASMPPLAPLPDDNPFDSSRQNGPEDRPAGQRAAGVPVRPISMEETRPGDAADSSSAAGIAESSDNRPGDWLAAFPGGQRIFGRPSCPCPCPQAPGAVAPGAVAPGAGAPGGAAPGAPAPAPIPAPGEAAPAAQPTPPSNALAGSFGATAGPASAAPNMIGDFSALAGTITTSINRAPNSNSISTAGGDRCFKVSDDNNPCLSDRVFLDYNGFRNALLGSDGASHDLNRCTFGVEKTVFDDWCSVELRIPFSQGLDATQSYAAGAPIAGTEFGNIPLIFKWQLSCSEEGCLSAGVAAVFPTGRDAVVDSPTGATLLVVKNQAFHLQPFIGWLWKPNACWFVEAFAELDFDANGNEVDAPAGTNFAPGTLVPVGRYSDQNLCYVDLKVGRWIYQSCDARFLTGIAPAVELHYTTTMQNTETVDGVTNPYNRVDVLDLTAGLHLQLGPLSTLTIGESVPLRDGGNRTFDNEFIVQLDRRF